MNGTNLDGRRIALLSTHYWPEVRRGTERLVHDLSAELAARDYTPLIVAGHRGRSSLHRADGVDVQLVRTLPAGPLPRFGYTEALGHLPAMALELRRARASIVHSFGFYEAALAGSAPMRGSDSTALTVTGIPQRPFWDGLLWRRRAIARAVSTSDAIIVISEAARRVLGWIGGDLRVIYPGVDLGAFRRSGARAPGPTFFCNAAIDDPRKRVDLVLEAFREIRSSISDARLILSSRGDPALRVRDGGVEYRDLDSHPSLLEAYSEAWATVLVSRDEAFGLVAVESLACGTPVIVSSDGGLVEAAGVGDHALLFDGERPAELAAAMREAIAREGDAAVEADARTQAERFSIERCTDAHLGLYEEIRSRG